MNGHRRSRLGVATPLLAFVLVYVLTGLLGAILMIEQYRPFVALYEYFSGTPVPRLSHEQTVISWLLLLAAPALVCVGYAVGVSLPGRFLGGRRAAGLVRRAQLETPELVPHAIFYPLALIGILSLRGAGSFDNASAWFHYDSWIASRRQAFEQIGFLGFVNVYLLIPLAAAWVLVTARPRRLVGHLFRWLPFLIALAIATLLFQKKAAVVVALIVFMAWIYSRVDTNRRRAAATAAGAAVVVIALYFAAVVLPVYSRSQEVVREHARATSSPSTPNATAAEAAKRLSPREARLVSQRHTAIFLYSALAPLVRTSAPSLYYPVIYPHKHRFYGLDVGQDILGIGAMPDDNIVTWRYMNPKQPGGTTAAPFQFVLYSQVGVGGALALSVLVGAILSLLWRAATSPAWPRPWASLLAAMVILLAVYLAIDSPRNSTLVSYGVVWGFVFVAVAAISVHLANRIGLGRRPAAAAAGPARQVRLGPRRPWLARDSNERPVGEENVARAFAEDIQSPVEHREQRPA